MVDYLLINEVNSVVVVTRPPTGQSESGPKPSTSIIDPQPPTGGQNLNLHSPTSAFPL